MKDSTKTEIILKIYYRLHMRPVTVKSIKKWLEGSGVECSERSVYRCLDDLTQYISVLGEEIEVLRSDTNQKIWKLKHSKASESLR